MQDVEPYVRATAISVVAAAVAVPSLWQHMNENVNVIDSCYSVLRQDSEALARRSAAKALTSAVQAGHLP